MLVQELIKRKRDGYELTETEISWFIKELVHDRISEGQLAAFAMAVFLNGMNILERINLTKSMRDSGTILDWSLSGPVVDKHSTGGVGDCVSLILAPALAACGAFVPMISGKGLGHTGGTLDKCSSIPGYNIAPSISSLKKTVEDVGCAIVGQTDDIAPADKRLYAVRDVTATVESIDLITSSILSKKLAASLDGLVLDIKFGNGAFMSNIEQAKTLVASLVEVGNGLGCKTTALLTDMNQPLCSSAGNALEVLRTVDVLIGSNTEPRLCKVVCALGGEILSSTGLSTGTVDGIRKIQNSLETGHAAEMFEKMIFALGGPQNFLAKRGTLLPQATIVQDIFSVNSGYIDYIDTRLIGMSLLELGGGRKRADDQLDLSVGFENILEIGSFVDKNTPLMRVHARSEESLEKIRPRLIEAFKVIEKPKDSQPLIMKLDPL